MVKGGHSHRATLKKDHKPFKSKHATKGQLKNFSKGKVEKNSKPKKALKVISKLERKNITKQSRDNKIEESKLARKLFEGSSATEKICTIISLTDDISNSEIASLIANCGTEGEKYSFTSPSIQSVSINRFKSNLKFILPNERDMIAILDAAKVSDYVIFGLSALKEAEEEWGEQILRGIIAQGVPSVIGVLPNAVTAYPKRNFQLDVKQSLTSYFKHFFPYEDKLYTLENEGECLNCLRLLCQKFPKPIHWRDSRGYLLADNITWEQNEGTDGYLCIEGDTRGIGFNSDRLVHIQRLGDFQLEKIEILPKKRKHIMDMDEEIKCFLPSESQETLNNLNPDKSSMDDDINIEDEDFYNSQAGIRMEGRHYFEEDGNNFSNNNRKLPKGTSEYQARWFLDDAAFEYSDEESDTEEIDIDIEGEPQYNEVDPLNAEDEDQDMYVELSPEEEARQLEEMRLRIRDEMEFPDEVELHPTESAKERFKSYRGVKSLGNCEWDCEEETPDKPAIWNRLMHIRNYKASKAKCKKDAIRASQVHAGSHVKLYLKASFAVFEKTQIEGYPLVVYALFEHEHKLGPINFSFEHWEAFNEPVASNENLIVQYGARRQVISPLFNQASNTPNNVHRFERFVQPGQMSIATCIAPISMSNVPAIFFKQDSEGNIKFIGKGTFLNSDNSRIIAERAIITGEPVKIHKRVVTVRYMFFNPDDINWFKAVPLFTKSGRTGYIKESLGTHGYYKATFDGKLTSQDVVAMSLYRRVWPNDSSSWTA